MPDPKLSRRKLLRRGALLGFGLLAGDAFALEPEWIEVERVEVSIRGLGRAFDGYRIALFSDVHYPRATDREFMRRVVRKAMAFDPHLIVVPGDLCDGRYDPSIPDMTGLYDGLGAPDGVFGTLGNHDHLYFDQALLRERIATQTPIELIENEHRMIQRGADAFALGAVGDLWLGRVDPVAAFDGVPHDVPRILLSHNPDVAQDQSWPTRIDLQLSGHTHGGQVRLPFLQALHVPSKYGNRFAKGLVQGRDYPVYVTRGVCSIRHVRLRCRPEVTHLTLRAA